MKKLNAYEVMGMIKAKQLQKQKGASLIEYALVVAAVVAISVVVFSGDAGTSINGAIEAKVTNAAKEIAK
ncbi:MAG: hypothetical protein JXK16_13485 [Thiotrichales bacterium]|nr:hypothetical protein [Thiotrichales bacterium]